MGGKGAFRTSEPKDRAAMCGRIFAQAPVEMAACITLISITRYRTQMQWTPHRCAIFANMRQGCLVLVYK